MVAAAARRRAPPVARLLGSSTAWAGVPLVVALLGLVWAAGPSGSRPLLARRQAAPAAGCSPPARRRPVAAGRRAHRHPRRRPRRARHRAAPDRALAARRHPEPAGRRRPSCSAPPAAGWPATRPAADALLERAQDAAEQALAELRAVARSILPPVLADRGLAGALSGLAAACPVPCRVDVDVPGRCAASVEATAYFVVAEALTNVARHSGAAHAGVTVRRRDGAAAAADHATTAAAAPTRPAAPA